MRARLTAAAMALCLLLAGCSGSTGGGDRTAVSTKKTAAGTVSRAEEEKAADSSTAPEQVSRSADLTPQLKAVSTCTDEFLQAMKTGDINTLADYTLPESEFGRLFEANRNTEGLSQLMKAIFGDMVWTHTQSTDAMDLAWLETTYSEKGQWTQSYVMAGVKEMLYFSEYFLLNYEDGETVPEDFMPQSEEEAIDLLESTVAKMPLLKNNWGIKCTMPDVGGKVYFDLDDDFIMDDTRLMETENAVIEDMAAVYLSYMVEDKGKVGDDEAKTDSSSELRTEYAGLLKNKEFEKAWQLIKPKANKESFGDITEYGDLSPDEQAEADRYVKENMDIVVTDFSTEVYDGSTRRHFFSQAWYDAVAEDNEGDIGAWLSDNNVKQSDGGVFFDITEDERLGSALSEYFRALENIHS